MIGVRNGARRRARLVHLGAHVPERVVTNEEMAQVVDTTDEWIFTRTGIRERRFAAEDEAASDLAVVAANTIIDESGIDPLDIDMLIVPTASPDHIFPATATLVADRIGARNAAAFDILAGCTGFIYGLAQATAFIESGLTGNVLVIGAEALTKITDQTDRRTCVLFGDAAAGALLVSEDEDAATGFLGFELGADGAGGPDLVVPAGGSRMPAQNGPLDNAQSCIQMNGREVFKFASRVMVESCTRLMEALEIPVGDIDCLIAHQANQRIIDHAVDRLGIAPERVFNNLEFYGNTSSASIPLAMLEARDAGKLSAGDLTLLVGFGAGLTWGSTILRYEPA